MNRDKERASTYRKSAGLFPVYFVGSGSRNA